MLAFWKNNESVSIPLDELKHEDFSEVIWVEIDNEEDYKLCDEIGDRLILICLQMITRLRKFLKSKFLC